MISPQLDIELGASPIVGSLQHSSYRTPASSSETSTSTSTPMQMLPESVLIKSLRELSITVLASIEESDYNYTATAHSGYTRNCAINNVHTVQTEMIADQIFKPREGQLLSDWLQDGRRYTDGALLESDNFELHPGTRRRWMTD